MKQINIALPDEIREYLDEISGKNGRRLSEEVRARLEQSVVDDRFDPSTRELAQDVMQLARLVAGNTVDDTFYTDRQRLDALKVAIDVWLSDLGQRLDLEPGSGLDPQSWGKAIAHAYTQLKPSLIKHRPGGDNLSEEKQ